MVKAFYTYDSLTLYNALSLEKTKSTDSKTEGYMSESDRLIEVLLLKY